MSDLITFFIIFNLFFLVLFFGRDYVVSAIDIIYKEVKLAVDFIRKKQKEEKILSKNEPTERKRDSKNLFKWLYVSKELVEKLALHSNVKIAYRTYITLCILCSILSGIMSILFFYSSEYIFFVKALILISVLLGGFYLPSFIFKSRSQDRIDTIDHDIPYFIDLMLICLDSGLTMEQAMRIVSREFKTINPILAEEFSKTYFEMELYLDQSRPFINLMERVPSKQLKSFISVIMYNKEQGGSIYDSLHQISISIYEDQMAVIAEKAQKLPGMLTAILTICSLPVMFIVLIGPHLPSILKAFE